MQGEKPEELDLAADWIKPGGPKSRENCIRLLLARGCNVNDKDLHDYTVLHYSVMWGWLSTTKMLIKAGADVNASTVAGKTPLMLAVDYKHDPVVNLLTLHKPTQLDTTDADGYTALTRAIEKGQDWLNIAQMLAERGANPNVVTTRRKTALKIACANENMAQVRLGASDMNPSLPRSNPTQPNPTQP